MSKKIILLFGPTASGKSKLALDIAKEFNCEIVNADSMQVYKEIKILSARPNQKDYKKIKHYLYGFQNVKKKNQNVMRSYVLILTLTIWIHGQ